MENKIKYTQDDFNEYLAKKEFISSSDIKNFLVSPKYYYFKKYQEKKDKEQKKHFALGTAIHSYVLTKELFHSDYVVSEKHDLRTKTGKEKLAEFTKQHEGKSIITEEEMKTIVAISDSCKQNKTLVSILEDSTPELSIYTVDKQTGLKIRMRPDIYCNSKPTICDLKSCVTSDIRNFKYNVFKYGYHITNAFYSHFSHKPCYVFAALEKEEPNQVSLYTLSPKIINEGSELFRMGLDLLAWSYKHNYWCDYSEFALLKTLYLGDNLDLFFDAKERDSFILEIE